MTREPEQAGMRGADAFPGLRKRLAEEYGTSVPPETIDRIARESLSELQDARIKEFVGVFAWRRARGRLRRSP